MTSANHHGTLVIAGSYGILITGPAGSGKTALALELLNHCAVWRYFGRLVSDDQVLLYKRGNRVIGQAPATIAGMVEARFCGPAAILHETAAIVDLVVELISDTVPTRFQWDETTEREGVTLPCLRLTQGDTAGAIRAISARLGVPPFVH